MHCVCRVLCAACVLRWAVEHAVRSPHGPSARHPRSRSNQALADLLEATHRGYFVFPRPDRNRLEGQLGNGELVKTRTADLERYLRRLADHPAIGTSEVGAADGSGWCGGRRPRRRAPEAASAASALEAAVHRRVTPASPCVHRGATQELRTFLEAEGQLSAAYDWQRLQPLRGGILEGVSRLPRQLLGTDTSVPSAVEASQNARNTSDLLRRMRELNERMKQDYGSSHPQLDGDEIGLRVGARRRGVQGMHRAGGAGSHSAVLWVSDGGFSMVLTRHGVRVPTCRRSGGPASRATSTNSPMHRARRRNSCKSLRIEGQVTSGQGVWKDDAIQCSGGGVPWSGTNGFRASGVRRYLWGCTCVRCGPRYTMCPVHDVSRLEGSRLEGKQQHGTACPEK